MRVTFYLVEIWDESSVEGRAQYLTTKKRHAKRIFAERCAGEDANGPEGIEEVVIEGSNVAEIAIAAASYVRLTNGEAETPNVSLVDSKIIPQVK